MTLVVFSRGVKQGSISSSFLAVPGWQWRCSTALKLGLKRFLISESSLHVQATLSDVGLSRGFEKMRSLGKMVLFLASFCTFDPCFDF